MKIKSITLLFALMGVFLSLQAQNQQTPGIEFRETTHDFGDIEQGAPTEHTFSFTNVSSAPIKLTYVKASCGCTTPKWTKEEVAPGASGQIAVKYNSQRVGRFTKSITVRYDSMDKPVMLYIKGEVATPPPGDAQIYSINQGGLAFDKVLGNMGTFDSDTDQSLEFKVKNVSPHPIKVKGIIKDDLVEVNLPFEILEPGQKDVITMSVTGSQFEKSNGFNSKVILQTDDVLQEDKSFDVTGRVNRVFSAEEKALMPNIEFQSTAYVGGTLIEGEKLDITYHFTNTGGTDLVIESVKASCGCTATSPKDKVIPPGASSEINASFNSRGRIGKQRKSITVRSNDPDNPTIILKLEADVERDPFHMGGDGPAASPSGLNR